MDAGRGLGELMKRYAVTVRVSGDQVYHVDAETPDEAEIECDRMIEAGHDPDHDYTTVDEIVRAEEL